MSPSVGCFNLFLDMSNKQFSFICIVFNDFQPCFSFIYLRPGSSDKELGRICGRFQIQVPMTIKILPIKKRKIFLSHFSSNYKISLLNVCMESSFPCLNTISKWSEGPITNLCTHPNYSPWNFKLCRNLNDCNIMAFFLLSGLEKYICFDLLHTRNVGS